MKKKLKELIENAETKTSGYFDCLMFVSQGKYKGFWGENGYDTMLILGFENASKKWYKVAYGQVDVFNIYKTTGCLTIDIDSNYGVPRLFVGGMMFKIDYDGISSCTAELVEMNKKCYMGTDFSFCGIKE